MPSNAEVAERYGYCRTCDATLVEGDCPFCESFDRVIGR